MLFLDGVVKMLRITGAGFKSAKPTIKACIIASFARGSPGYKQLAVAHGLSEVTKFGRLSWQSMHKAVVDAQDPADQRWACASDPRQECDEACALEPMNGLIMLLTMG